MIDPAYLPSVVQVIPVSGFVGVHPGKASDVALGQFNAFRFLVGQQMAGAALALTECHNDAALARAVLRQATVNAIFLALAGRT